MKDPIEVVIEAMELPVGFTGDGPSGFAIIRALEEAGYLILSKEPTEEMVTESLHGGDIPESYKAVIEWHRHKLRLSLAAAPRWSDQ